MGEWIKGLMDGWMDGYKDEWVDKVCACFSLLIKVAILDLFDIINHMQNTSRYQQSRRATLIGALTNALLALFKIIFACITYI